MWQIVLAAVAAALALLVSLYFVEQQTLDRQRLVVQNQVRENLQVIQTRLESQLNGNIQLARGLVAVVVANPNLTQREFERVAKPLFEGRSLLRNIGAAPNMVIRLMYPLVSNEKAIGMDYRKVPTQREAAERARDTGNLILAGPLNLAQGGEGLIARIPVFFDQEGARQKFWGLLSVVLDVDRLYKESGLFDAQLPIEVAIRGKDGKGHQGEVFYGNPDLFKTQVIQMAVTLPDGRWEIAARPRGGWKDDYSSLSFIRSVFGMALIFCVGAMLFLAYSIYQRNQSEENLRRSEKALNEAQHLAKIGSWEMNFVTDDFLGSDEIYRIFDLKPLPFNANRKTFLERVHPDDRKKVEEPLAPKAQGVEKYDVEYRVVRLSGEERVVLEHGEVERDAMGQPVRTIGVVQDITERKQMDRMKSEFVATISHELRTPLTSISGSLALIHSGRLGTLPESAQPMIDIALSNSKRLTLLVNDLLDMEKITSGNMDFDMTVQPIQPVITQAMETNLPYGKQLEVSFVQISPAVNINVRVDAQRLIQVLSNLLSNAAKFSSRGSSVEIDVRATESHHVRVSVIDHGTGIPAGFRDRLFEKFTQADSSNTRAKGGTGLGLAISKELIERMGGTIGFESEEGKGSTFYVELPIVEQVR